MNCRFGNWKKFESKSERKQLEPQQKKRVQQTLEKKVENRIFGLQKEKKFLRGDDPNEKKKKSWERRLKVQHFQRV